MKYLEELNPGDCFIWDNNTYVLSTDFKANGDKLCYSLNNGSPRWMNTNNIIEDIILYRLDKDNNIIALKDSKNEYANIKNSNIS
jgi:hypothetical protein